MTGSTAAGVLALLLLSLPGGMTPGRGYVQGDGVAEQALLSLERRWLAAGDDPDTVDAILADDFIHVLPVGFITKQQQVDYLRSHPAPARETKRFEDLRVRVYGSAGVATGVVAATAPDGQVRRTAFPDVFARRDGKWRAVNAQEMPVGAPGQVGAAPAALLPANLRQDIDVGNQAWIDGLEAGDPDHAVAGFAADAVSCGASGECASGTAAIAAVYRDVLARFGRATNASVRSEMLHVDHDLAYESGAAGAHFPHGHLLAGRFSTVWKLQPDGHWKIYRNMSLPAVQP